MVRSLRELRTQADEDVAKAAGSDNQAARPFYDPAAALLAALRFYAQERGFDDRWAQEVVAAGNRDAMTEVARALRQQWDIDSTTAAEWIGNVVRMRGLRERRSVMATANITLWRLSTS
jgi:hypothetical protein